MAREPTAMPLLAALLIATAIAAAAPRQAPPTAYGLEYASPGGATVRVTLRLPGPLTEGGVFVMPRAVPMGYGEQRYTFVSGLAAATAGGGAVAVTRQEGPRWRLDAGVATIAYSVDVRRMEAEVLSASDASKAREGSLIDTIWFAEGFGQYAAIMALAAGEPDPAAYRERLIERRFRQTLREAPPFLRRLSLVDLSRVASTRYAEDFRTGQLVFSRGGLLAAEIDPLVQRETGGRKSLADLLRALAARQAATGRGFTVDEFPAIVRAATGVDASAMVRAALEPLDR